MKGNIFRKRWVAAAAAAAVIMGGMPVSAWGGEAGQAKAAYEVGRVGNGTVELEESMETEESTETGTEIVEEGSCGDNVTYTLDSEGALRIKGSGDIRQNAFENRSGLTSVTILEGVTGIGTAAFMRCSGLTSVTIPSSVTIINNMAFWGCSHLTSIDVDEENKKYCSVDGVLFNYGMKTIVICPEGKEGVYQIPEGVADMADLAFSNCSKLTGVTIPEEVTRIGAYVFSGCSGLTSVTIPEGVTVIREHAFEGCSGLTNVTIPKGVTEIRYSAFSDCGRLTSIDVDEENKRYCSMDGVLFDYGMETICAYPAGKEGVYQIPEGVARIENDVFSGCSGLTGVTIPEGVTRIGSYAFSGCSGLTEVTIPEGVTEIEIGAFSGCSGLIGVEIPEGVTSIGDSAFGGCSGLTSVAIPEGVTSIGNLAFYNCGGLTIYCVENSFAHTYAVEHDIPFSFGQPPAKLPIYTITFDANGGSDLSQSSRTVESGMAIGELPTAMRTGYTLKGWYTAKTGGNLVTKDTTATEDFVLYAQWDKTEAPTEIVAEGSCGDNVTYTLDSEGVLRIKGSGDIPNDFLETCFSDAQKVKIKDVIIENGVTGIGDRAFLFCSGLTSVTLPSSVTSIGIRAFSHSGVTSVEIPEGVTSIGGGAFFGCGGLTSVEIPEGVTSIESGVFEDCSRLTSVTLPEGVTSIGDTAFFGCSGLTSVTLPSSVTSIEDCAFEDCSGLTSVMIPEGVTSIGNSAFSRCRGLTSVTLPSSVTSIADYAFAYCSGLTSINVDEGNARYYSVDGVLFDAEKNELCKYPAGREGVYQIPSEVTSIGDYAF